MLEDSRFQQGLRVSGAVSGWLLMLLYSVAATDDIRGRIPFVVGALWPSLATAGLFMLISVAAIAWIGALTKASAIGVALGAIVMTLVLLSNAIASLMPEMRSLLVVISVAVAATLGLVLWLVWERNHGVSSGSDQTR